MKQLNIEIKIHEQSSKVIDLIEALVKQFLRDNCIVSLSEQKVQQTACFHRATE